MNLFPPGQYGVIYIDPPWTYKMYSDAGHAKGPQAQYDCMTFEELKGLRDDILFASAPNSVMFMWTTWAADDSVDHMQQAMDLMRLYGFQRKTGGSWGKTTVHGKQAFGPGYIVRSADEPFLIGTHGKPRIKNHSTRNRIYTGDVPDNFNDLGISITGIRRDHSQKPDEVATLIEELFEGPYLEVFAQTQRPGWTAWGNKTDKYLSKL